MEAAGLAFGVVGLAGLFNVCLEIIEKVDTYKDFGQESRSIIAQFEADKLWFRKWGEAVGINELPQTGGRHRDLDDPRIYSSVENILASIRELHNSAENIQLGLQPASKGRQGKSLSIGAQPGASARSENTRKEFESPSRKITWVFRAKARYVAQVQQFGALVQRLYNLVPPNDPKRTGGNDIAEVEISSASSE
jgi:hypothetical protein